jgi:hypothetical protein
MKKILAIMSALITDGLDQTLLDTASYIGRLNFFKSNLESDIDELTKRIDEYDAILLERSQQTRQF